MSGGDDPRIFSRRALIRLVTHHCFLCRSGSTRLLRRAAKAPGGRGRSAPRSGGSPKSARSSGPPAVTGSALCCGHHIVVGRRGRVMFALGVGGAPPRAPCAAGKGVRALFGCPAALNARGGSGSCPRRAGTTGDGAERAGRFRSALAAVSGRPGAGRHRSRPAIGAHPAPGLRPGAVRPAPAAPGGRTPFGRRRRGERGSGRNRGARAAPFVQICCKGTPRRDRPREKARNINDSSRALRLDPGLCNRFGHDPAPDRPRSPTRTTATPPRTDAPGQ